jgi:uncharacterized protein (DUF2235 family)
MAATDRLTTTNIWRLSRAVPLSDGDRVNIMYVRGRGAEPRLIRECSYYESGIGADDPGVFNHVNAKIQNIIEGATGVGLADKVAKAYQFVVTNWQRGDEVCIFGFSRGAYTARLVAALLGVRHVALPAHRR